MYNLLEAADIVKRLYKYANYVWTIKSTVLLDNTVTIHIACGTTGKGIIFIVLSHVENKYSLSIEDEVIDGNYKIAQKIYTVGGVDRIIYKTYGKTKLEDEVLDEHHRPLILYKIFYEINKPCYMIK